MSCHLYTLNVILKRSTRQALSRPPLRGVDLPPLPLPLPPLSLPPPSHPGTWKQISTRFWNHLRFSQNENYNFLCCHFLKLAIHYFQVRDIYVNWDIYYVFISGVSIRRKDLLWDHLGTPERWSILGCRWSTFTHPNKNIDSSEIVLIFSYFTFFLQMFSSLATVFKADVQCVQCY